MRPRKLSVTQIETWMRDPYAIYSRYILRLKALPKLDVSPDVSDYGTLIHDVMDRFSKKYQDDLPVEPLDALIKIGEKEFESIPFDEVEYSSDGCDTEEKLIDHEDYHVERYKLENNGKLPPHNHQSVRRRLG